MTTFDPRNSDTELSRLRDELDDLRDESYRLNKEKAATIAEIERLKAELSKSGLGHQLHSKERRLHAFSEDIQALLTKHYIAPSDNEEKHLIDQVLDIVSYCQGIATHESDRYNEND